MPWCSTDPPLATWLRPNLRRVGRFEVQFHAVDMSSLDGGVSHQISPVFDVIAFEVVLCHTDFCSLRPFYLFDVHSQRGMCFCPAV